MCSNAHKFTHFSSVQSLSHVWLFVTPWIAVGNSCPSPSPRVHPNSCASSRWCHPAIPSSVVPYSSCPQPLPASESFPMSPVYAWGGQSIGVSALAVHPGLISFRMDWLDLLEIQGTLNSLLQHHSSKTSILRRSAFFTNQLSQPYMTTGKTIPLTRRNFVGKATSLLFNILSRLVQICTLWSSHTPLHLHVHINLKIINLLTYTLTHKETHIYPEAQPFSHM